MSHTPEDWRLLGEDLVSFKIVDVQDVPIATVWKHEFDVREWAEDNTRLILAAPTLLWASKNALSALETPGDLTPEEMGYVIDDLSAAIKEAEEGELDGE